MSDLEISILSWVREDLLPAYGIEEEVSRNDPELAEGLRSALASHEARIAELEEALRQIETICTESASDCRKRMGTRVGNALVTARAAIAKAEGK